MGENIWKRGEMHVNAVSSALRGEFMLNLSNSVLNDRRALWLTFLVSN